MAKLIANITKAEAGSAAIGQNAPAASIAAGMPIYVQGKVTDLGLFNGISTGKVGQGFYLTDSFEFAVFSGYLMSNPTERHCNTCLSNASIVDTGQSVQKMNYRP